eukprot:CAMPEP_0202021268 /NCGR_PEP_ID=MMETSP0905-20130828/46502_1 /ASSEMBLY_ACC=CAM_ASM_000554 /TAXON_ID=420261 /ORGANISM="Thalassiosira antarctica, Strain CCMP982" /LENGTH=100 /DNA_ID=CAMNT_0048583087 /DNA_START=105 /DNA_END=404 /DNA_ORIENTATION=-
MRWHIDQVVSSRDVAAIHDTPYPEYADYVIDASERIRGTKPIILLSTRRPRDWAAKRASHDANLVCKLKLVIRGLDHYIGENLYWCIQVALENGYHDKSI